MGSPKGKINKEDFKHWGQVAGIACTMALLDVVATTVIPDLNEAGGTTNCIIVTLLTLVGDLIRRWLRDTRPTPEPEPEPDDDGCDCDEEDEDNDRKPRRIGLFRKILIILGFRRR